MKPSDLPKMDSVIVACDTETSGLFTDDGARLAVVSVAWFEDGGRVVSMAWPFDQGERDKIAQAGLVFGEDPNLPESEWRALLAWLGRQRLVFQNAKFDLHHLRVGTRLWAGMDLEAALAWDTMLASKILWPTEPTSLKPTAERLGLTGGGERDAEAALKKALAAANKRHRQGLYRYDLLSWDEIETYAAMDTELTLRLWALQEDLFSEGVASRKAMAFKMEVLKVLYRMEVRGIGFDVDACREQAGIIRARMVEVKKRLPFKPTVPGAKDFFFGSGKGRLGLIPFKTTPTGLACLDDEVQAKLVEQGAPWAKEYSELRSLETALSMWYDGYPDKIGADGRLRTSFRQTEVKSGRMSVERINLQAIPKDDKTLEIEV